MQSNMSAGHRSLLTLILGTILGFFLAILLLSTPSKNNWLRRPNEFSPHHGDPHTGHELYDAEGPDQDFG